MQIDIDDPRLRVSECKQLREIAFRLQADDPKPRQSLSEGYRRAIEEVFGTCGEGERDRWQ